MTAARQHNLQEPRLKLIAAREFRMSIICVAQETIEKVCPHQRALYSQLHLANQLATEARHSRLARRRRPIPRPATLEYPATNPPQLWRMLTYYPVWDVSYMVAQWFTWGSVVWVINSFLVWLPSVHPSSAFRGETTNGGGISAFIGATIFEIGSIFLMIEAVNENRTQCFGWAFEEALEENGLLRLRPSSENCTHHHPNKKNLVGNRKIPSGETALTGTTTSAKLASSPASPNTSLQPSSGSPASPPSPHPILPLPCGRRRRILGPPGHRGSGFIISSLLFMIETQERWWKPAPRTLGW